MDKQDHLTNIAAKSVEFASSGLLSKEEGFGMHVSFFKHMVVKWPVGPSQPPACRIGIMSFIVDPSAYQTQL